MREAGTKEKKEKLGDNSIEKSKFQLTFKLSFASTVGHPLLLAKLN